MRVVCWGTYDLGKPRNRILLRGLGKAGVELVEIHNDVWNGVEDKGNIGGTWRKLRLILKWLAAYPELIWRYIRAPKHDAVFVGYMGHLDVLVLWPFAKLRGVPVIWDVFLSLYNTIVEDRRLVAPDSRWAKLLFAWEWLACRAVRRLVLDTGAHANYLSWRYDIAPNKVVSVLVGVEANSFSPATVVPRGGDPLTVWFYGQFIPLHGIETIVKAAQAAVDEPIRWVLIGKGQEEGRIRDLLAKAPANVEWIEWVEYRDLRDHIAQADICLGIFGESDKAALVIPNKVFQILSAGVPLITRDSPAIRELLSPDMPGVYLIPPADPEALIAAIRRFQEERPDLPARPLHRLVAERIAPRAVGEAMRDAITRTLERRGSGVRPCAE
jgi:glycosyltransferase involved in cell wall biosynthesis